MSFWTSFKQKCFILEPRDSRAEEPTQTSFNKSVKSISILCNAGLMRGVKDAADSSGWPGLYILNLCSNNFCSNQKMIKEHIHLNQQDYLFCRWITFCYDTSIIPSLHRYLTGQKEFPFIFILGIRKKSCHYIRGCIFEWILSGLCRACWRGHTGTQCVESVVSARALTLPCSGVIPAWVICYPHNQGRHHNQLLSLRWNLIRICHLCLSMYVINSQMAEDGFKLKVDILFKVRFRLFCFWLLNCSPECNLAAWIKRFWQRTRSLFIPIHCTLWRRFGWTDNNICFVK